MERSLAVDIAFLGVGEPGDGVPPENFDQFPIIHEGSVVFNFNDAASIDFRAYGMKDPWASFDKAGDPDSVEFAIPSPTAEEMKTFMGGKVTGGKWEAPSDIPAIFKSLKIQTAAYKGKYTEYIFTNCKIFGKMSQAPGVEDTDLLLVRATKLAAITSTGDQKTPFSREVKSVEEPAP